MKRNKLKGYNPISAGIAYTIGNMMIKGIPFLTLPIFTRILTPAEFGLYNTYLSYENIMTIVLGFGLYGTIRVARSQYKEKFEEYISAACGLQIFLAIIIYPLIYLGYTMINPQGWFDKRLLIILLLHCLSMQLFNIASAKYAIEGEVSQNLIISFVMTIANVGISLFLCYFAFTNERYIGRILGTFLAAMLVAIIVMVKQVKYSCKWMSKEYWSFALKMGLPLMPHMLSLTILAQCDKIMIQNMVGNTEAGIYSLAVNITGIVTVLVTSIDNAWAPWFYKKLEQGDYEEVRKNNNYMIAMFCFVVAEILLVAPELIRIMSEERYWDSVYPFAPLLMSVLFNFIYLVPVNFEYYHKKTAYISYSTVLTAILNIVFNIILINYMGYIGAAYATCISKIVLLAMHWRRARAIENVKIANLSWIIGFSLLTAVVAAVSLIFVNNIIIRYLLMVVLFIVLCYESLKIESVKALLTKVKRRK